MGPAMCPEGAHPITHQFQKAVICRQGKGWVHGRINMLEE
ncbi:hypothetical protein HAPAU_38100 [Halalkalicoccus paucihalophilus]|uniref:Uncharacterized protein n=1 Tax=Halalkalicoccus paucihalophilus TaxID=1008153 RepID=A0A151A9X8_9EURY|nr:hypothetical protein HAPAU_38100 [Halalkalicoccus paucihalophilus]